MKPSILANMACVCSLASIEAECGRNAPGIKTSISLVCLDDIDAIGAATDHVVSAFTCATGKASSEFAILRKDNDLKSTPQENGGYTTEVKGFISKQSAAKAKILTDLATDENYVVVITDQNSKKWIIGSVDHPCKVRAGAVTTPKNGYELTILWEEHADLPYEFSGALPLTD